MSDYKNSDPEQVAFQINEKTFESLFITHWKKVYAICYYHTKNIELSKGMVQDIFKSLWERRDKLQIDKSIENYLLRSAKLKVCEYIRNKVVSTKHLEYIAETYCDHDNCTELQIAYNDLATQVNQLVDTLTYQCKKVYQMSQEQGMSNKNIASSLLISEKTVEYHLTKAKALLRKNLSQYRV